MRRVRAAVIHISRWPSYGTARFAPPPAPRFTRSFALLFLLPPPRVQTDQYNINLHQRMALRRPGFKFGKNREKICQNLAKWATIRQHVFAKSDKICQNFLKLTKSANIFWIN